MRRFIVGWKQLGFAQRFGAHIVCYADDLSIFGRSPARQMLMAVEGMMNQLQLPINRDKTRCLRCPQEPMEFLGYRIGWNYRNDGSAYIGTRPSKASVQNLCCKISELTSRKYGLMESREMVRRLNWTLSGWSNYFHLGQVYPAYTAINLHTTRRLRQWFSRKHQARTEILRAFLRQKAVDGTWSDTPVAEDVVPAVCVSGMLERKPDAGNPHVRFDERGRGNVGQG